MYFLELDARKKKKYDIHLYLPTNITTVELIKKGKVVVEAKFDENHVCYLQEKLNTNQQMTKRVS